MPARFKCYSLPLEHFLIFKKIKNKIKKKKFKIYKKYKDLVFASFAKPIFFLDYINSFFPRKGRKVNIKLFSRTRFIEMLLKASVFQYNFQYVSILNIIFNTVIT